MAVRSAVKISSHNDANISTFANIQDRISSFYSKFSEKQKKTVSPYIFTGVRSDFARLARRLLSKSVGLVLGGGGARGIAVILLL
jgi:lysophospholipid hydrolase